MADEDLPEYIGSNKETLADPKPKRKAPPAPPAAPVYNQHPQIDGLEDEAATPAPRVAVYNKPAPGAAHPRHSVLAPALRVDEAEHAFNLATLEVTAATRHLRACEIAEAEAETSLMAHLPKPSQDELLREYAASQARQRAERVAQGLPAEAQVVTKVGNSPIDRQAAQRMRTAPGIVSNPLRSAIARRTV